MDRVYVNADRLQDYLKTKNITARELASEMGIDYSYLFRALKKERYVGGKFIASLLRVCSELNYNDLFISEQALTKVKSA